VVENIGTSAVVTAMEGNKMTSEDNVPNKDVLSSRRSLLSCESAHGVNIL